MPSRKIGHNSPYDEHGMPLGAETVDYDNKEDVAQATVKDKKVDLDHNLSDVEFEEPKIKRTEYNPALNNTAIEVKGHKMPTKEDHIGIGGPEAHPHTVDLEDPANAREEIVRDSIAKGFDDVPKLPEVAKEEDVTKVVDGEHNTDGVSDQDKEEIQENAEAKPDTSKEEDSEEDDLLKGL